MKLNLKLGDILRMVGWLETLLSALKRVAPRGGAMEDDGADVVVILDPAEEEAAAALGVTFE